MPYATLVRKGEFLTLKTKSEIFKIIINKIFTRLQNKTQLFSVSADDHYHSRLGHTLEVMTIASNITSYLKKYFKLDEEAIKKGSLLHDLGHTPFGHAGERALHQILSGNDNCMGRVNDITLLVVEQGFKHNINSGLLYKEIASYPAEYLSLDEKVMDAIIKHTKIYYETTEKDKKLDYGFRYVICDFKNLTSPDYYNHNPKYMEGYIVSIADEIAQICSDTLDLLTFKSDFHKELTQTRLYQILVKKNLNFKKMNYRNQIAEFSNELISIFVNEMKKQKKYIILPKDNIFMVIMDEINQIKTKYIKENTFINEFDKQKDLSIKTLFSYYYLNPLEMDKGAFIFFCHVIKNTKGLSKYIYNKIEELNKLNWTENKVFINKSKKQIIDLVYESRDNLRDSNISIRTRKDNKTIYATFLRSIAVFISEMSDRHADEICRQIQESKISLKKY